MMMTMMMMMMTTMMMMMMMMMIMYNCILLIYQEANQPGRKRQQGLLPKLQTPEYNFVIIIKFVFLW